MNYRQVKQQLFDRLREQFNGTDRRRRIIRAAVPIPDLPLIPWLAAQSLPGKLHIADRQDTRQLAACGIADRIQQQEAAAMTAACDEIAARLEQAPAGTRYYGGFRFAGQPPQDDSWREFGCALFLLPRFELLQSSEQGALLRCNALLDGKPTDALLDQVDAELQQLTIDIEPGAEQEPLPDLSLETHTPRETVWKEMATDALSRLEQTELEKLVLARSTRLQFNDALPPLALFARLRRQTPGCLHFYLQPGSKSAFLGATPEILFHRRGRKVESAAIAGTRPRGRDPQDDEQLARELAESDKERREHAFVSRAIQTALQPLCRRSDLETEAHVLKLRQIQHLCQSFHGELREDVDDGTLLTALHPTPAVGGFPTAAALTALTELEPFDRGWYAAPIGWLGKESSGFAVAIRSGLITGKVLQLYAGAGIVEGSQPDAEWRELNSKLGGFRDAIS